MLAALFLFGMRASASAIVVDMLLSDFPSIKISDALNFIESAW
jgi:hypothetical protein